MGISFWHIVVVLVVVLVVFGAGKLPHVMGDLGKGIRSFKDGLNADPTKTTDVSDKRLPPSDKAS
jgi:sec-independent protein translocase protein TatA